MSIDLVVGTNKVIFGRQSADGTWEIVRSTDTNLGGHIADPSDTSGKMLPDGRSAWAAELEARILAAAVEQTDLSLPLGLPDDLPWWARERPALRRFQASRWSALVRLRKTVGDPSIGPYATYLRAETGGDGPAPVALGPGWDPATWSDMDWRVNGEPVGMEVMTSDGLRFVGGDRNARRIVVRSVADHVANWLCENDPSTEGPERGLRHTVPVRTTKSATRVVGRHGEALMAAYEDPESSHSHLDQLEYGNLLADVEGLRASARNAGIREVARCSGLPVQSVHKWVRGAMSSEDLIVGVAMALGEIEAEPVRSCALDGCERRVQSLRAKWCSPSHRAQGSRVACELSRLGKGRTSWTGEAQREEAWRKSHQW